MSFTVDDLKVAQENNPGAFVGIVNGEMTIIVPGVGAMVSTGELGPRRGLSQAIEKAMVDATEQAMLEGIPLSNTEEYLKRKLAAREEVKRQYNEWLANLAAKANEK